MNFGMIFLCLLIGCVIGFEAGKGFAVKRIRDALNELAKDLNVRAEELRKKQEERQHEQLFNGSKRRDNPDCKGRTAFHETEQ